ncbi:MAG: alginate lyase family protein [Phycisphaerae bacterium]
MSTTSDNQNLPPGGGMHSPAQLARTRQAIAGGMWPILEAWQGLQAEVDTSLDREPQAVTDFNVPGAYIDHPGHQRALAALAGDARTAYSCGIAWQLETDEDRRLRHARKAVEVLTAWAETNKQASGHDGDLCMAYAGTGLLFAAELLDSCEVWARAERDAFDLWVQSVFLASCERIVHRENNWGDWGILGCIAGHRLLGDESAVDGYIQRLRGRIDHGIHPDGTMPLEIQRGPTGIWYTYFALAPLTAACQIAFNARAVDLFSYVPPAGGGIEAALDYLLAYCNRPADWPHYDGDDLVNAPTPETWYGTLFEAMAGVYNKPAYADWVSPARPAMTRGHHYAWAVPTLLRPLAVRPDIPSR